MFQTVALLACFVEVSLKEKYKQQRTKVNGLLRSVKPVSSELNRLKSTLGL